MECGRVTLIRRDMWAAPSPKGKASMWSVFTLFITESTLIPKGFAGSDKHKSLAFPLGEGVTRLVRVTDEGHPKTYRSVPANSSINPNLTYAPGFNRIRSSAHVLWSFSHSFRLNIWKIT